MKTNQPLEEKIVQTALKMFNENGIEYVGMRELAAALGIRIGNLNYYFPTKDDLVNRLSLLLAEENSKIIVPIDDMTMPLFLDMLSRVFENHLKYRCLMLSFVHIMQRNPLIAKRYNKTQSERSDTWSKNVQALVAKKLLNADKEEIACLVSTISLIARFWISEAVVSFRKESEDEQARHYLRMVARIILPYSTTKGRRYLEDYLAQI
ncbi:TetR/AcrR family transcriptional regulator [Chryseolinea sp. T2]|uniref:TetR/AcrR family transcriptional regulator n=1 Tax=Chryseolinea sp. T2 TaxID=3129255 RepID=UPI00307891A3